MSENYDSSSLIQKFTHGNFYVNKKVATEMERLFAYESWKLDYVRTSIRFSNRLSIVTLNTHSLHTHLNDILQDEDLMNNMILCFQETHTNWPPNEDKFSKFSFNATYSVHGVLSCIERNIDIISTKNFCNNKVEIVMLELYVQHVCIMNIYVAPFTFVSTIIETISTAKMQMIYSHCILVIVGDLNIGIHADSQSRKQLIDYMNSQQLQEISNIFFPKTKNQIHHIWTNLDCSNCEFSILDSYWNDHDTIHAFLYLNLILLQTIHCISVHRHLHKFEFWPL
jgi:hypothetical protein